MGIPRAAPPAGALCCALHAENSDRCGEFHAGEIGYIYGNPDLLRAKPIGKVLGFSELMATICTHFAETVDPNGENLPQRDVYSVDSGTYIELGADAGQKSQLIVGEMALTQKA